MKQQYIKKLFTLVGFLILAFVAVNMNACSKDKNENNPHNFGWGGVPGAGGHLGQGTGTAADMQVYLTFVGTNGGQAGANGYLHVTSNMCPGLYAGTYNLHTIQPGLYANGDFENIRLITNTGVEFYITRGWFNNQQLPDGSRRMYLDVNIPGCPTVFN